jgi:multicomponent Na+:H+ antiporter subunit D
MQRLVGADQRHAVNVLAFALAGVSIMGLPPSGGFVAKWMLLEAAWQRAAGWGGSP